jgi:hypothetical protein
MNDGLAARRSITIPQKNPHPSIPQGCSTSVLFLPNDFRPLATGFDSLLADSQPGVQGHAVLFQMNQ